ncbi:hypothetical protein RHECNPAF_1700013 [Rhizobium etli CNPAF512]|nr:hypothetical protein RHECNPAF_1700013 [Rhizobium etli CNPAF512]
MEPLPSFGVIDGGVWLQTVDHHGPGHGYFSVPQPWSNCPASILSVERLFATQSGLVLRNMYRLALCSGDFATRHQSSNATHRPRRKQRCLVAESPCAPTW